MSSRTAIPRLRAEEAALAGEGPQKKEGRASGHHPPVAPSSLWHHQPTRRRPPVPAHRPPKSRLGGDLLELLLLLVGIGLTLGIALMDYAAGPHISCSIFYLIPVIACAWWGGSPHGILVALAGVITWHTADLVENPAIPLSAGLFNGAARFG